MESDNPIVSGEGPLDVPIMPDVRNSRLEADSAWDIPDTVEGLCRPLEEGPWNMAFH